MNFQRHLALGNLCISKQRYAQAREHLENAARLQPKHAELRALLGNVLIVLGEIDEAERAFRQGLEHDPDNVDLILGLATVHRGRGHFESAMESYRSAARLKPSDPQVLSNLAAACLEACEPDELIASCPESARANPEALSHMVSALNYQSSLGSEVVAAAHRAWGLRCLQDQHAKTAPRRRPVAAERSLRLGFVAKDFCQHPVGRFAALLFSHLDRKRFELSVYDNGSRADAVNEHLKSLVPNWRNIREISDEAAAHWIEQDQTDVLVDLAGHTIGNRLPVFARQPAPVQIALFAYPSTTGLKTIQYRITDPYADPPGLTEHLYTEELVRLRQTAWVYVPPVDLPVAGPSPALLNQSCVFGCLNNPMKLSKACVQLWGSILRRLPQARLKLLAQDETHQIRLASRFASAGAAPGQLQFVPGADLPAYFAYHHGVDLMLDPFPYNGGVTTCDALWMGVPVVTLAGDSYLSRQGVSILSNVGLPQCIAATQEEFAQKAIAFATIPSVLAELRNDLRVRVKDSPLMNYRDYTGELGDSLDRLLGA
ncbi:MAG: tetratricopeptide repeat protein [Verrucomicrobia bacterium]|nr:tetratricopeptide repeat protein [Verrucomicrobiota bacterium]